MNSTRDQEVSRRHQELLRVISGGAAVVCDDATEGVLTIRASDEPRVITREPDVYDLLLSVGVTEMSYPFNKTHVNRVDREHAETACEALTDEDVARRLHRAYAAVDEDTYIMSRGIGGSVLIAALRLLPRWGSWYKLFVFITLITALTCGVIDHENKLVYLTELEQARGEGADAERITTLSAKADKHSFLSGVKIGLLSNIFTGFFATIFIMWEIHFLSRLNERCRPLWRVTVRGPHPLGRFYAWCTRFAHALHTKPLPVITWSALWFVLCRLWCDTWGWSFALFFTTWFIVFYVVVRLALALYTCSLSLLTDWCGRHADVSASAVLVNSDIYDHTGNQDIKVVYKARRGTDLKTALTTSAKLAWCYVVSHLVNMGVQRNESSRTIGNTLF